MRHHYRSPCACISCFHVVFVLCSSVFVFRGFNNQKMVSHFSIATTIQQHCFILVLVPVHVGPQKRSGKFVGAHTSGLNGWGDFFFFPFNLSFMVECDPCLFLITKEYFHLHSAGFIHFHNNLAFFSQLMGSLIQIRK